MSLPEPGLRERKRRATSRTIQQVALTIALEQGLQAVTVDEISRRADISPRTFFNYFATKEQALLGDDPHLPDDDAVEAFVTNGTGDLLADLCGLLVRSTEALVQEHSLMPERHRVLKENPQLFSQRMASMKEFQAALAEVIARRLAVDDPLLAADAGARGRRARLVALVALAAVRHAWWEWSQGVEGMPEDGSAGLVDAISTSFGELSALVSRTLV